MSVDLSDLVGDPVPSGKRRGRPTKAEAEARLAQAVRADLPHYTEFRKPVGITFLADILGKQPKQIQKRLEKCPVASWTTHVGKPTPLYNFLEAISFLITPRGSIEDWFAQQNAASLPPYVNKMFWDSANQRNRVMLASGDLWHSEDVMLVLGRVSMLIRQDVKMWIEDLPEKELLSNKQYNALVDATNRLVGDIRKTLVEMPRETLSMTAHIKSELDASGKMPLSDVSPDGDE